MNSKSYKEKTTENGKDRERFFLRYGINRFPERLKEAMRRADIPSNNQLAKVTELSEATIRKYLKGETYPTLDRLASLADACRCSLAWLASGDDDRPQNETHFNDPLVNNNDSVPQEFTRVLSYLTEEQIKRFLKVIYTRGIDTILQLDGDLDTQLAALPFEEKERLLALHEAKKGASEGSDKNDLGDPTHRHAG